MRELKLWGFLLRFSFCLKKLQYSCSKQLGPPFLWWVIENTTLKTHMFDWQLRPWLPWWKSAGPLPFDPFDCLACCLCFSFFSLNPLSANPTKLSKVIWFSFSLMRHHSFATFLLILFVFFATSNSLDHCINDFCGNDYNELFLQNDWPIKCIER